MRRLLYFGYYTKNTQPKQFKKHLTYASERTGRTKASLLLDVINCAWKYNISFEDYFLFRFFENTEHNYRVEWAGTGFMYEYQKTMNPKSERSVLENKIEFLSKYNKYISRQWSTIDKLEANFINLSNNSNNLIVLKNSMGQAGGQVEVLDMTNYSMQALKQYMKSKNYDLIEQYVEQHPKLQELSPSGLNTIRIITQSNNGKIDLCAARLRISINSAIDNMAAGNLAAGVNLQNGTVTTDGFYSDITKNPETCHPVTKKTIKGFQIPLWDQVLDLSINAAQKHPENRSIGWDIAITKNSVELIEGNHNWCKLLYQLPVKQGLKEQLLQYL